MSGGTTRPRDAVLLLAALVFSLPATADTGGTDRWVVTLEPYLWFPAADLRVHTTVPGLGGPVGTGARNIDVSAETRPSDYLEHLRMAVMLIGEARRGRWSVFTDIMYVDFGDQDSRVRSVSGPLGVLPGHLETKGEIGLSTTAWILAGGCRVARPPRRASICSSAFAIWTWIAVSI